MGLSWFLSKYSLIAAGFGSATIVPLLYSQGGSLSESNGPRVQLLTKNVAPLRKNESFVNKISELVSENKTLTHPLPALKVDHDLGKEYQRLVSYEEFKNIWGTKGFKEEGNINLKGAEDMTVLDAWDKFFENNKGSSSFFSQDEANILPFWNYDFPYIAVELPKELLPPINSGWIKLVFVSKDSEAAKRIKHDLVIAEKIKEEVSKFEKIQSSGGADREKYIRDKTLNRVMQPSEDSDIYIVPNPKNLLRVWLSDWDNLSAKEQYSLFETSHYEKTEDHQEVSILRRWWKGKSYRMWIHHKELKPEDIGINNKQFDVGFDSKDSSPKNFNLKLKWSKNFLLNLLVWYSYTYKLGNNQLSYYESQKEGGWNLKYIYEEGDGKNSSDFAGWIKDWYKGTGKRSEWVYWWNLAIIRGRTFNRNERINWVGEVMDSLSDSWGKIKSKDNN